MSSRFGTKKVVPSLGLGSVGYLCGQRAGLTYLGYATVPFNGADISMGAPDILWENAKLKSRICK